MKFVKPSKLQIFLNITSVVVTIYCKFQACVVAYCMHCEPWIRKSSQPRNHGEVGKFATMAIRKRCEATVSQTTCRCWWLETEAET